MSCKIFVQDECWKPPYVIFLSLSESFFFPFAVYVDQTENSVLRSIGLKGDLL